MQVLIFLYSWVWLVWIPWESQPNQPPTVNLTLLEPSETVVPGQQVAFTVEVSDPEDGSSNYLEIPAHQVFVEVRHFQSKPSIDNTAAGLVDNSLGLQEIKDGNCFDCHHWKADLVGPSMEKIMTTYDQNARSQLINSIKQGSVGKWGSEMMPAQEISDSQANKITDWLLGNESNKIHDLYRGLEGLFVADKQIDKGYYLLTASYKDRGTGGAVNNRLTGYHSVVLTIDH